MFALLRIEVLLNAIRRSWRMLIILR